MTTDGRRPAPAVGADRDAAEVARLIQVMQTLRQDCPWDAEQTHRSLMQYLVEETCEVVEAIEALPAQPTPADHDHLAEELGDLLAQVVFHSNIAVETDPSLTVGRIAAGIADKLIARHPYVFASGDVPEDLDASWEQRKAVEKGRKSVLEGIPQQLSALARANKIISRARSRAVPMTFPDEPIDSDTLGRELITLVARAQANGIDPEQAARDAVRRLEAEIRSAEG